MQKNEQETNNLHLVGDSVKLVDRKQIENTPFEAVKWDEEPYFLALGSYRLPVRGETIEQLQENLEAQKWEVITSIIGISLQISNTQ